MSYHEMLHIVFIINGFTALNFIFYKKGWTFCACVTCSCTQLSQKLYVKIYILEYKILCPVQHNDENSTLYLGQCCPKYTVLDYLGSMVNNNTKNA